MNIEVEGKLSPSQEVFSSVMAVCKHLRHVENVSVKISTDRDVEVSFAWQGKVFLSFVGSTSESYGCKGVYCFPVSKEEVNRLGECLKQNNMDDKLLNNTVFKSLSGAIMVWNHHQLLELADSVNKEISITTQKSQELLRFCLVSVK